MAKKHRAYWKGYLRLSLVTIAVEVYNAVESKTEISFRQIHKPSGKRVNYEKVVQGVGKIDNADIVKGYEVDTDTYVILEPEEIDALKLESKKTIDLVQFVDAERRRLPLLRTPLFRGAGRRTRRRRLRRHPRRACARPASSGSPRSPSAAANGWSPSRRWATGSSWKCCAMPTNCVIPPTSSPKCRRQSRRRKWSISPCS